MNSIMLRSVFLCGICLWFACDCWLYSKQKSWDKRKRIVFLLLTSMLAITCTLGFIWYWHHQQMRSLENETYQRITATAEMDSPDPLESSFTLTNGGPYQIQNPRITCQSNLIVGNKGVSVIVGGNLKIGYASDTPLQGGGDAQTDECLSLFRFAEETDCVDVTIKFEYALKAYPGAYKNKLFRFAAQRKHSIFSWHRQPVEAKGSHCYAYIDPKEREELRDSNNSFLTPP